MFCFSKMNRIFNIIFTSVALWLLEVRRHEKLKYPQFQMKSEILNNSERPSKKNLLKSTVLRGFTFSASAIEARCHTHPYIAHAWYSDVSLKVVSCCRICSNDSVRICVIILWYYMPNPLPQFYNLVCL